MEKQKVTGTPAAQAWFRWKRAGKAPATRDAALTIVAFQLKKLGVDFEKSELKKQIAQSFLNEDGNENEISDNLSFITWDLSINYGRAMDYSKDVNYFMGLLSQAASILSHVRFTLPSRNRTISIPHTAIVPGSGYGRQAITEMSREMLHRVIESELADTLLKLERWQTMKADTTQLINAARKLAEAALPPGYRVSITAPAVKGKPKTRIVATRKPVKVVKPVRRKVAA